MPIVNLDTHILLFALEDELSYRERRVLGANAWGVSAIVVWEIARLFQLARVVLRFAWLARNESLWHRREEIGDLCSYPERSHVIFFRRRGPHLQILRVLHASMDPNQVSE